MAMIVADALTEAELLKERRERGLDKYDEVWDGVYVMHALPNDEHQDIVGGLTSVLREAFQQQGLGQVRPGINLASDSNDWQSDYRCPDVVVFLNDSEAECHGAFWTGGPALAVEVVSPDDEYRQKFDFYSRVGTRELLIIDREPWRLELYRHDGSALVPCAAGEIDGDKFDSGTLPISFRLVAGSPRPKILVSHKVTGHEWIV